MVLTMLFDCFFIMIYRAVYGELKCLIDVVKRNLMHRKKQIHGSGTNIKESFKLLKII